MSIKRTQSPLPSSPCTCSIGRNWMCLELRISASRDPGYVNLLHSIQYLCLWLAPLCSPELKNANNRSGCQSRRQAYAMARCSCSSLSVCSLYVLVVSIKCCAITGYLLSTTLCVGLLAGTRHTSSSGAGCSKGSDFLSSGEALLSCVCSLSRSFLVGFCASAGHHRS